MADFGIAEVAAAASILGTGVSAIGAIQSGQAQASAQRYQAQVADNNAQIANWNAKAAEDAQTVKTQAIMRAGDQRLGAQRAAMGADGVTLDSGSALDVQGATVQNTTIDAQNSQYQGQLAAYGYRTQAGNFTAQSGLDTMAADNSSTAGMINAGSTLLSGAGQVTSRWYQLSGPTPSDPYGDALGQPRMGALY